MPLIDYFYVAAIPSCENGGKGPEE